MQPSRPSRNALRGFEATAAISPLLTSQVTQGEPDFVF